MSNKSGVVENTDNMDVNSRTGSININTKGVTSNSMDVSENHIDGATSKSIVSNRSSHANVNGVNADSRQNQASSKVS